MAGLDGYMGRWIHYFVWFAALDLDSIVMHKFCFVQALNLLHLVAFFSHCMYVCMYVLADLKHI